MNGCSEDSHAIDGRELLHAIVGEFLLMCRDIVDTY